MEVLALVIAGLFALIWLFLTIAEKIQAPKKRLIKELKDANIINNNLNEETIELTKRITDLERCIEEKDATYRLLEDSNTETISKLTTLYSDFLTVQFQISSDVLERKKRPALKEALRIQELRKKTRSHIEQFRMMMYHYEKLFQVFPELAKYVEDFESIKSLEDVVSIETLTEEFDSVSFYLSKDEYRDLSENERNQLALDRYIGGQKSKWQIGRDYEMFCAWVYEKKGWNVNRFGIEKKLEDMGRDLIATKGDDHHIIQCKYWASHKKIHEKHITQLYGSAIEYGMDLPDNIKVTPIFMTNINLSETAVRFAKRLGVVIQSNLELQDFPRIKCNLNRDEYGETKIYHLPFDQQYDNTKINKKGEMYAKTVSQAVRAGFRRAYRYYGA